MNDIAVSLMLLGALSPQGGSLPFWATAGRYGIMPDTGGMTALLSASSPFDQSRTLQWHWGASLGVRSDGLGTDFLPDELYAGLRWKKLRLDAGIWHPAGDFFAAAPELGSLSVTAGNCMQSCNARSFPGCSLSLEPLDVPFTGGHLQFFGSFGDYVTTDSRYVSGALVHNTSAFLRGRMGDHLSITAGFDHYTLWGGNSPEFGPQTVSLGNYLRILTGRSGAADSSLGDQINSLGDHRGREVLRLDWKEQDWSLSFQHDIPYDDRSGMIFKNFPDGVNTLCLSLGGERPWLGSVLYEYHHTMNQSGDCERRPATAEEMTSGDPRIIDGDTVVGGADNYCNNYEYRSGWTAWGRQIGSPLFYSRGTREGSWSRYGITTGTWNNLLTAHHLALSGNLFHKLPYRLMLTWVRCHGCWFSESFNHGAENRFDPPLEQFSSGLETVIPLLGDRLRIVPALYLDAGDALPRSFAALLSVHYKLLPR